MKVFVLFSLVAVALAGPPAKPQQAMQPVLPEKAQAHLQNAVDHWSLIEAALTDQELPTVRQFNLDPTVLQQWYNDFLANLHNLQLPSQLSQYVPTGTTRLTLDPAQLQQWYNDFLANLHSMQLPSQLSQYLPAATARLTLDPAQLQNLYNQVPSFPTMTLPAKL